MSDMTFKTTGNTFTATANNSAALGNTRNSATYTALYALMKRTLDIVSVSVGMAVLFPLLAVVAILIRLDSKGPVLFGQTRVGKNGKHFTCWKFRSMYIDAEARKQQLLHLNERQDAITFKMREDPRITRVGKFIRKFSIDELPQLWNVITGDMTLVGPRPAIPDEVAKYSPEERRRLEVTPGITCIWQISGRADLPFQDQVRLDIEYVESRNLTKDIMILIKTVPAVLLAKGAY